MADKPIVFLHGEVKSPPFSMAARIETGILLRRLQQGESLSMPHSRPMPGIAPGCHELRVPDESVSWRLIYFVDIDAIVILDCWAKRTPQTPRAVLENCRHRLKRYLKSGGGV